MYQESDLTLSKLLEIVSSYHDKEALILIPGNPNQAVNHLHTSRPTTQKLQGRCHKCNKVGLLACDCRCSQGHKCTKCGKVGHYAICCKSKPANTKDPKQSPRQVPNKKPTHHINSVESDMNTPNHIPDDGDYYAFTAADNSESPSAVQVLIEDKPIDIMVDSAASCILISNEAFQSLFGGIVSVTPCSK